MRVTGFLEAGVLPAGLRLAVGLLGFLALVAIRYPFDVTAGRPARPKIELWMIGPSPDVHLESS